MDAPEPRSPVTVAVVAGADSKLLDAHLGQLAACLRPGDSVVVSAPGHDPATPGTWRVAGTRGTLRQPAAVPGVREVVVALDVRAVPEGGWIDPLVRALEDPAIGACAPRTNIAAGDELLVGVPYRPHETWARRALVYSLAARRRAEVLDAEVLCGPCVAVRREVVEAAGGLEVLGGPDPAGTLVAAAAGLGLRTVVAGGAYLHHGGGTAPRPGSRSAGARPLVTACLIVKDERDNLGRCLASLERFCEEVVVYDTGSTDGTADLARRSGAVVVEGRWDDDFAAARNAALEHCRGEWVLWIDADEALTGDPAAQREALAAAGADVEAMVVMIDNLRGTAASTTVAHPACRLFRRAYGCWSGKVHEQVVARSGPADLELAVAKSVRITHWGYLASEFARKDKAARNLRSALLEVSGSDGPTPPDKLVDLARSYGLAGRPEEALRTAREAVAADPAPAVRRRALRTVVAALVSLGRAEEALEAAGELRAASRRTVTADVETARVLVSLGRHHEALEVLGRVRPGTDDDGNEHAAGSLAALRATALARAGRPGEAADVLLETLRSEGGMDVHVGTLVWCLEAAGRSLAEIAEAVPQGRAVAFLGQLPQLEAGVADRVLEAWHAAAPSRPVLAAASTVADRLPLERRAVWSTRLRAADLAHACPLVRPTGHALETLLASALALERFADRRGRMTVAALVQRLTRNERERVRRDLASLAPSVSGYFERLVDALGPIAAPLGATPTGTPAASRPRPVPAPAASPLPLGLREGVCVVGDLPGATPTDLARLHEELLPRLARRLGATPVALVGGAGTAGLLPGALELGMPADPLPWVRASRAVLVCSTRGAEPWLATARSCGTPALVAAGADPDEVVAALCALGDPRMDALWARVAPVRPGGLQDPGRAADSTGAARTAAEVPARR